MRLLTLLADAGVYDQYTEPRGCSILTASTIRPPMDLILLRTVDVYRLSEFLAMLSSQLTCKSDRTIDHVCLMQHSGCVGSDDVSMARLATQDSCVAPSTFPRSWSHHNMLSSEQPSAPQVLPSRIQRVLLHQLILTSL